jgi:hypothetical protein
MRKIGPVKSAHADLAEAFVFQFLDDCSFPEGPGKNENSKTSNTKSQDVIFWTD